MRLYKMGCFIKLITLNRVNGICLWPFGIYIREGKWSARTINHELIHWEQQKEFPIVFYLWYLVEAIIRGYMKISFEQEAYDNDDNYTYLYTRKHFAWFKYLKK